MTHDPGNGHFVRPAAPIDGCPRIEDHALIGDGNTAASWEGSTSTLHTRTSRPSHGRQRVDRTLPGVVLLRPQ